MPLSAVDAITPAFQHTKQQLLQPFRAGQWARLALVGLLAGELSSGGGGCNGNFRMPTHPAGNQRFLDAGLAFLHPTLSGALIALLVVLGLVLAVLFLFVSSVMRFILFDSVVTKQCRIREGWSRREKPGLRYFLWQILVMLAFGAGLTILVGIPVAFGFVAGWLKEPQEHLVPLILGGMVLFFLVLAFIVVQLVVQVMSKDFVVPQMALEEISAIEGWRRLWPWLKREKGDYAGYVGMKIVMAIGAAVAIGIAATIVILLMAIPLGGLGAVAVISGKAAGLTWNLYTITLAIVVGCILLAVIVYAVSLVSVPATVFFPAYSIYFFASRYPALDALLHPAPPAPLGPTQPTLPTPPLPPTPEPIG